MYEELLLEWNPWWNQNYSYRGVIRDQLKELERLLKLRHIIAILGTRRSGKTNLMLQLIQKLPKNNVCFLKVDDARIKKDFQTIERLIEEYQMLKEPKGRTYLFMDEIQVLPRWQEYLKTIYDLRDCKIIISGSNSSMLKQDAVSKLTGRIIPTTTYPFSLREYLRLKGISVTGKVSMLTKKLAIKKQFYEYLKEGGFPEAVLQEDKFLKTAILEEYLSSIVLKDVLLHHNLSNSRKLLEISQYIISNSAKAFNFKRLAEMFRVSKDTIAAYIEYFEEAYLLFKVHIFDYSLKKQLVNPKKIYSIDTGLANSVSFRFSEDKGRLLENAVFIELKRRGKEVYYHKDKKECDFITTEKGKPTEAIQVTWELNQENQKRETEGLKEAMQKHNIKKGTIITNDQEQTTNNIKITPAWKWMLEKIPY